MYDIGLTLCAQTEAVFSSLITHETRCSNCLRGFKKKIVGNFTLTKATSVFNFAETVCDAREMHTI